MASYLALATGCGLMLPGDMFRRGLFSKGEPFLYVDKNLECVVCHQAFLFTHGEARWYASRGFAEPKRCPTCRKLPRTNVTTVKYESDVVMDKVE